MTPFEMQQQQQQQTAAGDNECALRTAVALAIVKARHERKATSRKEEALAARLLRLKSSMATLVKLLKRKTASGGGAVMLEQLLTQLTAETNSDDLLRTSEGAPLCQQESSSKGAPTSQPTPAASGLPCSQLQLGSSGPDGLSSRLSQLQQGSTQAASSFTDASKCHDPGQASLQQQQQQQHFHEQLLKARSQHGWPFGSSQICGGMQEHVIHQGIAQASREAQACMHFGSPADAAVLQERTASLNRLLETAHAVQLTAAALLTPASGPATSQAPLDTFCTQTGHQTVLAFVEETLVCLPQSALRQAYIKETAKLLAACLLSCQGQQAAVLAADLTALLGKLLEVHAGQGKLGSGQPAQPRVMQVRLDGASAFLTSALHEPQLGQLLLLSCSQYLDSTCDYLAKLSERIRSFRSDPAATANILQEAAAQHESSKLVLKVLDACTEKLPAWIACCGPSRLSRSLQQQSLHHEGQEQDEGGEDSLVSVLTLAVQHLVAVYSRVHAACASSSLVATGITRSLASLAASLQHAARFAPASIPYAAVDPQMVTGVLSGRRAACLRLCIELREKFKPDF